MCTSIHTCIYTREYECIINKYTHLCLVQSTQLVRSVGRPLRRGSSEDCKPLIVPAAMFYVRDCMKTAPHRLMGQIRPWATWRSTVALSHFRRGQPYVDTTMNIRLAVNMLSCSSRGARLRARMSCAKLSTVKHSGLETGSDYFLRCEGGFPEVGLLERLDHNLQCQLRMRQSFLTLRTEPDTISETLSFKNT
jgi:hypothetical protein